MDSILSNILIKHGCADLESFLFDEFKSRFEETLATRVNNDSETLNTLLSSATVTLTAPVALHQRKLEEFAHLKETRADIDTAVNKLVDSLNKQLSSRLAHLQQERFNIDMKVSNLFRIDPPSISTASPLDEFFIRDKLAIALSVGDAINRDSLSNFRLVESVICPLLQAPPGSSLELLESSFSHLPQSKRLEILCAAERWLADRSASSTDVKKLVDAQMRLLNRKSQFKYGRN